MPEDQNTAVLEDAVDDAKALYDSPDVHNVVEDIGPVIRETKSGWRTSEFWLTVATLAAVNLSGVILTLPDKYQAIASAVVAGLYAISRGQAKQNIPHVEDPVPEA